MEAVIEEALRRALERGTEKPKVGTYLPSLLPSCLLRQYLIYTEGHTISLEKSGIFKIGELLHGFLKEALKSSTAKVIAEERPLILTFPDDEEWIRISGRLDFLIEVGDERKLVEVKSIASLPSEPLEHHTLQVQLYLVALGLEEALLVYLEKHSLSWRIFRVKYDGELLRMLLERATTLNHALRVRRPPEPDGKPWECRHCEFRDGCERGRGSSPRLSPSLTNSKEVQPCSETSRT